MNCALLRGPFAAAAIAIATAAITAIIAVAVATAVITIATSALRHRSPPHHAPAAGGEGEGAWE